MTQIMRFTSYRIVSFSPHIVQTVLNVLRTDEGLSARFERVEIIGAARTGVYPGHRAQPHSINSPRIVVYRCQVGLLNIVYPQSQAAIVRTCPTRCPPIQLDKMHCIADREPTGVRPGRAIVDQPASDLVRT